MWTVLCLILISFADVKGFGNESFPIPNIMKILTYAQKADVSEVCMEHLKEYLNGCTNGPKSWALQMMDSITKIPDGVLMGHFDIPGHFDECVEVVHENGLFKGKHCMIETSLKTQVDFDTGLSFSYGICVPSTCNSSDVRNAIQNVLNTSFNISININLEETDCSTNEYRPLRTEDWITLSFIIFIVLIAVGSTVYDFVKRNIKHEPSHQLWSSFSIINNGNMLFKISQTTAQLKCLHGIRFLSISWVVLGHTYFTLIFSAAYNLGHISRFMKDKAFIPVSNAFVSVDSFFFLSGLLVCLVFFRDIVKKKTYDVPVAFIHRYMRLTPPFAILILIHATIITRIGNGPFWNRRIDRTEEACREGWWAGILYILNYVKPTAMCLGQSWYLSADMQMYWISPLILYPLLWFPAYAPFILVFLIIVAAFVNFTVGFVNNLLPNFSTNLGESTMNQFKLEYAPFHTRMAPYLIGMATGYIICGLQAKKIRLNLPKHWVILGWLVWTCVLGASFFGIARFIESDYTQLESSFYLAFHRVGWALSLSWMVVACVAGFGGPLNDFLSLDFFQPLAKLSYCNFLVHMTLQSYRLYTSRTNQYLRHFEIIYAYAGDLLISNVIAIPIVLLFEFPFTHIDRYFFQRLEIFPFPKPKKDRKLKGEEVIEEKKNTSLAPTEVDAEKGKVNPTEVDVEKGKVNPTFNES